MRLTIEPVSGRSAWRAFHELPMRLHANDLCFVPPLLIEQRYHLDPRWNPHFEDADACFWIARSGNRTVGRISAQIDRVAVAQLGEPVGFFGHFDAEDEPEAVSALFAAAENWLRRRGMQTVRGPFELSINDRCGLLIEGFDTPPSFMMGHGRPYQAACVETAGYRKARDLIAYHIRLEDPLPERGLRLMVRRKPSPLAVRQLSWRDYRREIDIVMDIFNDAWAQNWGFAPLTGKRLDHLAKTLKPILHRDLAVIAEIAGEPVGMMIALPNINECIADLQGRLLPLGWAKLLWRLKMGRLRTARVPLMGVRRRLQSSFLGGSIMMAMFDRLRQAGLRRGVREAELSWVLEDNLPMRRVAEGMGARIYKTYRIYEKAL